jgi:Putative auto-transporter adhesin, head GIN domain
LRAVLVSPGGGTLDLHDLVATDSTAHLQGTGTIRVYATSTLEATLTGVGTILYRGDPAVTTHNTGTGTVARE